MKKKPKKIVKKAPKKKVSKKQLEFERRSKAAKKGWKTKRLNQKIVESKKKLKKALAIQKVIRTKLSPKLRPKKTRASSAKDKEIAALRKELAAKERGIAEKDVAHKREVVKLMNVISGELNFDTHDFEDPALNKWVKVNPLDFSPRDRKWLHRDGSIALYPAKYRHLDGSDEMWSQLNQFKDTPNRFRMMAEHLADIYDTDIEEVYNFYYSP